MDRQLGEVLLVEGDPADAELIAGILQDLSRVTVAGGAEEALRLLARTAPRLLLVADRLPGMDGLELVARLRIDAKLRAIPVVLLTADPATADLVRAYALGANSVVRKPVRFEELQATIRDVAAYWLQRNEVVR